MSRRRGFIVSSGNFAAPPPPAASDADLILDNHGVVDVDGTGALIWRNVTLGSFGAVDAALLFAAGVDLGSFGTVDVALVDELRWKNATLGPFGTLDVQGDDDLTAGVDLGLVGTVDMQGDDDLTAGLSLDFSSTDVALDVAFTAGLTIDGQGSWDLSWRDDRLRSGVDLGSFGAIDIAFDEPLVAGLSLDSGSVDLAWRDDRLEAGLDLGVFGSLNLAWRDDRLHAGLDAGSFGAVDVGHGTAFVHSWTYATRHVTTSGTPTSPANAYGRPDGSSAELSAGDGSVDVEWFSDDLTTLSGVTPIPEMMQYMAAHQINIAPAPTQQRAITWRFSPLSIVASLYNSGLAGLGYAFNHSFIESAILNCTMLSDYARATLDAGSLTYLQWAESSRYYTFHTDSVAAVGTHLIDAIVSSCWGYTGTAPTVTRIPTETDTGWTLSAFASDGRRQEKGAAVGGNAYYDGPDISGTSLLIARIGTGGTAANYQARLVWGADDSSPLVNGDGLWLTMEFPGSGATRTNYPTFSLNGGTVVAHNLTSASHLNEPNAISESKVGVLVSIYTVEHDGGASADVTVIWHRAPNNNVVVFDGVTVTPTGVLDLATNYCGIQAPTLSAGPTWLNDFVFAT